MKILFRTLIIIAILLLGFIAFLLTPLGLRTVVYVADHYTPGELHFKKISGVIIGPITMENVRYVEKNRTITIKQLYLNWNLLALFEKKLVINKLKITQLHIISTEKPQEITAQSIEDDINTILNFTPPSLPIQIIIHHAQINGIEITGHDKKSMHIQSAQWTYQEKHGDWTAKFVTQLPKTAEIQTVQFQITGKNQTQDVAVDGLIKGKHTHWVLEGRGPRNALQLKTTQSQFLDGTLAVDMTVSLDHPYPINGTINAKSLNFSFINPHLLNTLSGQIDLTHTKDSLETKVTLQTPAGTAKVTASHKKAWHADWDINFDDLSKIDTNLSGKLISKGEIIEQASRFHTKGSLHLSDFEGPNLLVSKADLTWKFHLKDKNGMHLDFEAKKIHLGSIALHTVNAKLTGDAGNHVLTSHIRYPQGKVEFLLRGKWQQSQWHAVIEKLNITRKKQLLWHLKKQATIISTQQSFSLSPLCLTGHNTGEMCLSGGWGKNTPLAFHLNGFLPLSFFSNFVHKSVATISSGRLSLNLKLTEENGKPIITGQAALSDGNVLLTGPNIQLSNISLDIIGKNNQLIITAKAYSKNQPITITSTTDLAKSTHPTSIKITSDNTLVFNTEEYVVYATADINALIDNRTITLSGTLHIPSANIQPYDFHSTVTLPVDDIVYVGKRAQSDFWTINSNLEITLGDDVNIKAAGITAQLGGNVLITGAVNRGLFATGEVVVKKGHYSVFGRTLTIEPGSYLNYTHNLLNNPILNIKASKIIPTVSSIGASSLLGNEMKVGVNLGGPIKSPKVTFYSSPANLSQTDIMSYLLLGYGTNTNAQGKTDYLAQALSALDATSKGLIGKENPITQIQQGLGLSEMGVESETMVDTQGNPLSRQSSFVIGKHLSRDFYVRYSIGLMDSASVLQLRYLFSRNWAAQTNYNADGDYGLDILYTIERN